jgi:prolipoprotein diacylglyceryltransferase
VIVAQAIGRLGNYFNQELFGRATTLPWGLDVYLRTPGGAAGRQADCGLGGAPEFPTSYIKADPTVLCGTYHPTFLYELLWNLGIAAVLVWADRKFRLGRGQVFWLYVAGYTLGRGWIEMLRIDTANKFFGIRINVFTSIVLFVVAVAILVARRNVGREDPASLRGKPSGSDPDDAADEVDRSEAGGVERDAADDADRVGDADGEAQVAKVGSADGSRGNADGPASGSDVADHRPDA